LTRLTADESEAYPHQNYMYPEYFGLKEPSFSITPDPHYLYLSREHREALAHLLYGAGEGGGFVLLTGEVGTGKTTICRAFLEQLPEHVDIALILNPALTVPELLHSICHEFGVKVPGYVTSSKVLVDQLNRYLLLAHAKRRRPVLMIDEAQNLQPEVLEQIRLLTNLETHRHKLLQIFLVGQPELRELLEQKRLRQLAQRITARYHLLPLSQKDTKEYIRHRLAIAGVERRLFTPAALRRIYHLSGGIPRLINILCDRALLGAFATHRHIVDSRILNKAARELTGKLELSGWQRWYRPLRTTILLSILLAGAGWLAYTWKQQQLFTEESPKTAAEISAYSPNTQSTGSQYSPASTELEAEIEAEIEAAELEAAELEAAELEAAEPEAAEPEATEPEAAEPEAAEPEAAEPEAAEPEAAEPEAAEPEAAEPEATEPEAAEPEATEPEAAEPEAELPIKMAPGIPAQQQEPPTPILRIEQLTTDRRSAMALLLKRWGPIIYSKLEPMEPCRFAETKGLRCREGKGGWNKLYSYNRPALIRLTDGNGTDSGYALVEGLNFNFALLNLGTDKVRVPLTQLDPYWSGDYLLLWQPPLEGTMVISPRASSQSIQWLRETMSRLPGWVSSNTGSTGFDPALKREVQRFQRHRGLVPDGIVGPETLIHLNTATGVPGIPHLESIP